MAFLSSRSCGKSSFTAKLGGSILSLEIECKYLDPDFVSLGAKLASSNAKHLSAVFEDNLVFEHNDGLPSLLKAGTLLRLRTIYGPDEPKYLLTLKLKVPDSANCKIRDEREVYVADGQALQDIFLGLNYKIVARYEKMRVTWQYKSVLVCLDTLPFGQFVELEGSEDDILAAAKDLGLDQLQKSTKSYHDIHQDRLKAGETNLNFVFEPSERARLIESVS